MAIAMSIGRVKDKFKKMKRTATGVAVWVNTLDVYKYIGAADITLQTAFGFEYMKNFLGADVVFISSEIPEGVVIATPLNNIVAYYVDPGDSEFEKLDYLIQQIQQQDSSDSMHREHMKELSLIYLQSWGYVSYVNTLMRSPIQALEAEIHRLLESYILQQ